MPRREKHVVNVVVFLPMISRVENFSLMVYCYLQKEQRKLSVQVSFESDTSHTNYIFECIPSTHIVCKSLRISMPSAKKMRSQHFNPTKCFNFFTFMSYLEVHLKTSFLNSVLLLNWFHE